jgi:hypothetical protein
MRQSWPMGTSDAHLPPLSPPMMTQSRIEGAGYACILARLIGPSNGSALITRTAADECWELPFGEDQGGGRHGPTSRFRPRALTVPRPLMLPQCRMARTSKWAVRLARPNALTCGLWNAIPE